MQSFIDILKNIYLATIVLIGVAWVIDIPQYFGLSLISAEWMGPLLSIGIAAAFLKHPYSKKAGLFEIILGFAALLSWCWMVLRKVMTTSNTQKHISNIYIYICFYI